MGSKKQEEKKHVVILGGGFAGVAAGLSLSEYLSGDEDYEIILIDRKDYHLYHSALYEAATTQHGLVEAKKVKKTLTIPFADIFRRTGIKVFKGYVDGIDLENGHVSTDSRTVYFDYLLIALGSIADFYGVTNLSKYGFTLKSIEDAVMIRNRVEEIVSKKDSATLVIGGGGFAGVEFAGELCNLVKHECRFHNKDPKNFKVMIVEGAPSYLPGLSEKVSMLVASRLAHMGIEARFSTLVTDAGKDFVELNKKEQIKCDLLVWTGGVRSCRLPINSDLERDKKDRTLATEFLNLKKFPNVFLAGDDVCMTDPITKKMPPQTAQEALRQGKHAAKNIFRMIRRKDLLPYHIGPVRFVIPVAGKYSIYYTPNLIVTGFFGWCVRRFADLRYFLSILGPVKAFKLWMFENKIFIKND